MKASLKFPALLLLALCACQMVSATELTEEKIQNLEALTSDIGFATSYFARKNPEEAARLDDVTLVRTATAKTPAKMKPFDEANVIVRGTPQGVILVCDAQRTIGLFEDADCSPEVDRRYEKGANKPCEFTLKVEAVCPPK
jgi:hypothetical protein